MRITWPALIAVLLVTFFLLSSLATCQGEPAFGTLTIDGTAIPLKHAIAYEIHDVEGERLGDAPLRSVTLLLSSAPISEKEARDWSLLVEAARSKKLSALELRFDIKKKGLFGMTVYHSKDPEEPANMNIMISGKPEKYPLRNLKLSFARVSGAVTMPEADTWPHFREVGKPGTFRIDASFDAPVLPAPNVTAILKGARAAASPQAATVMRFAALCRTGRVEAIRPAVTPGSWERFQAIPAEQKSKFAQIMKMMMPSDAAIRKGPLLVVVRGEAAKVLLKERGGHSSWSLRRIGGKWLLDN